MLSLLIGCLRARASLEIPASETALREAVQQGGDIVFTNAGTIVLSEPITLQLSVQLSSLFPLTLSGGKTSRVFEVRPEATLDVVGLTIAHGRAASGGAVYNEGSFNARSCTFRGNLAVGQDGAEPGDRGEDAWGGAIFSKGPMQLTGCVFEDNHAAGGNGKSGFVDCVQPCGSGGHGFGGAVATVGSVVLSNCLFMTNTASGGTGGSATPGGLAGSGGAGIGGALRADGVCIARSVGFSNNAALGGAAGSGGAPGGPAGGGAINVESGNLLLSCVRFIANQAIGAPASAATSNVLDGAAGGESTGSALYINGGVSVIERCLMRYNVLSGGNGSAGADHDAALNQAVSTGGNGGAGGGVNGTVCNIGHMLLSESTFADNILRGGNGGAGGHGDIAGNGGAGGHCYGGGLCNMGTVTLRNCTIASNACAGGTGGAGGHAGGLLAVSAGMGGAGGDAGAAGVWTDMHHDEALLESCTLAGNEVIVGTGGKGGGNDSMPPAPDGALGIFRGVNLGIMGTNRVRNTICSSSAAAPQTVGIVVDLGGNLCSDGTCQFTNPSSLNNTDPRLLPLAENGGPTPTLLPLRGSRAIHHAVRSGFPASDQRGYTRLSAIRHDIGAVETSAPRGLTVCGNVTDGTNGVGEITVVAGRSSSVTDATGYYEIFGVARGYRVVQPSAEGLSFTPHRYRINMTRNRTLPPFVATP